ncbi:hypothetical protein PENARI_c047G08774 [Penicillium arizonense]|uniref:Uncharacterized protein n=1 Tax=Penicillium arizonense TaxID=1835702 RepID=A0A1F5L2U7_PENAI|nr:hypothetical protein PENARI_c047G08774 [Penicillium arizonense]OGE47376.1 hypothetical protein PENARI_c047G08774 [Penicillium arizonense]
MAHNEAEDCSLGYADQWLKMRDTKPFDISSTPDSPAAEQDEDCEYDDDQTYVDEGYLQMDNGNPDVIEGGYCALGTHSGESAQDVPPELHGWFYTVYTELDAQVSDLKDQFYRQNGWNENAQKSLETVAQKYDEMPAIQEALAIVQADIAELREAIAALEGNKGKDGVVGRKSKRLP